MTFKDTDAEISDSQDNPESDRQGNEAEFELVEDDFVSDKIGKTSEGGNDARKNATSPFDGMRKMRPTTFSVHDPFSCCCGCFTAFFLCLAIVLGYLFYFGTRQLSVSLDAAGDSINGLCTQIATGVKGAVQKAVEECKRDSRKTVDINYDFVSAEGVDKYCVAEIIENVSRRVERNKWGFSSILKIDSDAVFKYCVPMRKLKLEISTSSENPQIIKIRGIFAPLRLEIPVVCKIKRQNLMRSYLPSLNDAALDYVASDLPSELEAKGKAPDMMRLADAESKKSLEIFFREALLPMLGFTRTEIKKMDVEISFDSSLNPSSPDEIKSTGIKSK